ncbi:MAG: phage terminase large subunit family protein, partial [Pirellulales bacterium]|nr:phage terminase large subunit family protein [Pirellulales bacterium]
DGNELLLEDFPEVCFPIQCLDGIANRCSGQLYQGQRTHTGWTAKEIVLPTIANSKASGAIIKVAGITGRIRGMKTKAQDGRSLRPSLVVLDDPQTDESARSLSQCATRESILAGAVLGLAGPGKKISGIMPCTVIRPGDMADRILDRDKHPQWQGERTKMVYSFPANEKLWDRYAQIRAEGLRAERGLADATEFYRQHRTEMDEGAVVAWPERYNHDELSAIQHAMNLKLQDERAFWAEYQNEPLAEITTEEEDLSADQIAGKINRLGRGEVPVGCNHLTMFVDVQQTLLYYVVTAWEDDFTGYIITYGACPDQNRSHFTARDARPTLAQTASGAGLEGAIYGGLEALTQKYLKHRFRRDDGAEMRIDRCLIDANWGLSTDVVYQFCRQSAHSTILMPSHGRFVGASSIPFSEYKRKVGDRVGHNWRVPNVHGRRQVRHVVYDTNYWKSFIYARLAVAMGPAQNGVGRAAGQSPQNAGDRFVHAGVHGQNARGGRLPLGRDRRRLFGGRIRPTDARAGLPDAAYRDARVGGRVCPPGRPRYPAGLRRRHGHHPGRILHDEPAGDSRERDEQDPAGLLPGHPDRGLPALRGRLGKRLQGGQSLPAAGHRRIRAGGPRR